MRGNESKRGKKEGRQEGMLKKKIKCLFLFLRCPYSMHPICMCILYIYIYIHISISPCIPMIPTSDSCHAAVPTLLWQSNAFQAGTTPFPPGPRVGRSVIRSRWFHFMDSTFWKFTSNIYVWLQISYIYIYIIYTCIRYIYIYIRYIHMLNHSELPFLQGWLGNSHGKSVLHRWEIIELSRHASLRRASWKWWRPQRLQPFQA